MISRSDKQRKYRVKTRSRMIKTSLGISVILTTFALAAVLMIKSISAPESKQGITHQPKASSPTHKPEARELETSIGFVGDVLFGGKVADLLAQKGYSYPYSDVSHWLQQPDLTVANLETPITERGTPRDKKYVFRSSPQALPELISSGIDAVSLANNHVLDYGEEGLIDTLHFLDEAGIHRMGAGKNSEEAYQPLFLNKKGVRIALFSFSRVLPDPSWAAGRNQPGIAAAYDPKLAIAAIEKAQRLADIVVVTVHWGVELKEQPEDYQQAIAHRFIDAGADLVVGTHPHVLQGLENYKGKWIAYSLGNFIFTSSTNSATQKTAILTATCTKEAKCSLHLRPIFTQWAHPVPMNEADGKKLIAHINRISINGLVQTNGNVMIKK